MPAERVSRLCPDCSALLSSDNAEIQKTVSESLKKFNKESGLANRFALLQVTRATSGVRAALDAARLYFARRVAATSARLRYLAFSGEIHGTCQRFTNFVSALFLFLSSWPWERITTPSTPSRRQPAPTTKKQARTTTARSWSASFL